MGVSNKCFKDCCFGTKDCSKDCCNSTLDCEVTYDLSGKMKGFQGLPLAIATGQERNYGKI
jgi:hypothetical protein